MAASSAGDERFLLAHELVLVLQILRGDEVLLDQLLCSARASMCDAVSCASSCFFFAVAWSSAAWNVRGSISAISVAGLHFLAFLEVDRLDLAR